MDAWHVRPRPRFRLSLGACVIAVAIALMLSVIVQCVLLSHHYSGAHRDERTAFLDQHTASRRALLVATAQGEGKRTAPSLSKPLQSLQNHVRMNTDLLPNDRASMPITNTDTDDKSTISLAPLSSCKRTLTVRLTPSIGFGSQTTWLINSAIFSSVSSRALVVDDSVWNYGHFHYYFQRNTSIGLMTPSSRELIVDELQWTFPVVGLQTRRSQPVFANDSYCVVPTNIHQQLYCNCDADHNADHLLVTDVEWSPMGHAMEAFNQRPPHALPPPNDGNTWLFLMKRRWFFRLYHLRSELLARIATTMTEWNIRPKLLPSDASLLIDTAASNSAARYISMHVRRGDKITEAAYAPYLHFVEAAELLFRTDDALRSSWTVQSPEMFQPDNRQLCNVSGLSFPYHQPVIMLATDDPRTHTDLPLLRPCWRWLRWDAPSPLLPATPPTLRDHQSHTAPISEATAVQGEIASGHSEQRFNRLSAEEKRHSTESLLVSLGLLSSADYAVVTMSSNLGRVICLSRGYADCIQQKRVKSLDKAWFFY